jgi:hypothetical protein
LGHVEEWIQRREAGDQKVKKTMKKTMKKIFYSLHFEELGIGMPRRPRDMGEPTDAWITTRTRFTLQVSIISVAPPLQTLCTQGR